MIRTIYNFNNIHSLLDTKRSTQAFFLVGDDIGQIEFCTKKIIKKFAFKNKVQISTFYQEQIAQNYTDIMLKIQSLNLFYNKRIIIIKNIKQHLKQKEISIYQEMIKTHVLILHGFNIKKTSQTTQILTNITMMIHCYQLDIKQLERYIKNFLSIHRILYEQHTIFLLINKLRTNNLLIINHELKKIQYFIKNQKFNPDIIHYISHYTSESSIAQLCQNILYYKQNDLISDIKQSDILINNHLIIVKKMQQFLHRIISIIDIQQNSHQDINTIISNFKPTIFFKEKNILKKLSYMNIGIISLLKELILLEIKIKQGYVLTKVLFTDFLLHQTLQCSSMNILDINNHNQ